LKVKETKMAEKESKYSLSNSKPSSLLLHFEEDLIPQG